jgi:hypothetical protein
VTHQTGTGSGFQLHLLLLLLVVVVSCSAPAPDPDRQDPGGPLRAKFVTGPNGVGTAPLRNSVGATAPPPPSVATQRLAKTVTSGSALGLGSTRMSATKHLNLARLTACAGGQNRSRKMVFAPMNRRDRGIKHPGSHGELQPKVLNRCRTLFASARCVGAARRATLRPHRCAAFEWRRWLGVNDVYARRERPEHLGGFRSWP